jgi:hypothetical protein
MNTTQEQKTGEEEMSYGPGAKPDANKIIRLFLTDMAEAAKRTYPLWRERLNDSLTEIAGENNPIVAELFTYRPVEDVYFAGVVGMEAARIGHYLPPTTKNALLTALGDQVDAAAGRSDRLVSDLVFMLVGRIEAETGVDRMRMPYDLTVQVLLQKIGIADSDATRPLLQDLLALHNLGEPLARFIPAWWKHHAAEVDSAGFMPIPKKPGTKPAYA